MVPFGSPVIVRMPPDAFIAAGERRQDIYETVLFGGVGEHLAVRFGTTGAPISLTTACATGASAIQLGVEAIQRGEGPTVVSFVTVFVILYVLVNLLIDLLYGLLDPRIRYA